MVVLSMAILVAVAIPLYVMRRPTARSSVALEQPDAGRPSAQIVRKQEADQPGADIDLGELQRVKCSASSKSRGNEGALCDPQPFFETALRNAIRESEQCAPRTGKEGTINFVLEIDFNRNRLNVFPGRSGKWKGPQAKSAAQCVLRALPSPQWEQLTHRYRYSMLAILATYPAPHPLEVLPSFE